MTTAAREKEFQLRLCWSIEAAWPEPPPLIKLASDTASLVALPGGRWSQRKQTFGGKGFPDILATTWQGQTRITRGHSVLLAWECKIVPVTRQTRHGYTPSLLSPEQHTWMEELYHCGADAYVMLLLWPAGGSWPDATLVRIPWPRLSSRWTVPQLKAQSDTFPYLPHLHGSEGGWRLT